MSFREKNRPSGSDVDEDSCFLRKSGELSPTPTYDSTGGKPLLYELSCRHPGGRHVYNPMRPKNLSLADVATATSERRTFFGLRGALNIAPLRTDVAASLRGFRFCPSAKRQLNFGGS